MDNLIKAKIVVELLNNSKQKIITTKQMKNYFKFFKGNMAHVAIGFGQWSSYTGTELFFKISKLFKSLSALSVSSKLQVALY